MFLICYQSVNRALNAGFMACKVKYNRIRLKYNHKKAGQVNRPALYCSMPVFYTCFSSCLLPA